MPAAQQAAWPLYVKPCRNGGAPCAQKKSLIIGPAMMPPSGR